MWCQSTSDDLNSEGLWSGATYLWPQHNQRYVLQHIVLATKPRLNLELSSRPGVGPMPDENSLRRTSSIRAKLANRPWLGSQNCMTLSERSKT